MQCWWCKIHASERKRLNLSEYLATPCRVTMNISWADFKTVLSFQLPWWDLWERCFQYQCSLYIFSMCSHLSCLLLQFNMFMSIVNSGKRPQILGQTQKWTNNHTRPKNRHMHAHTPIACNTILQSSRPFRGRDSKCIVLCYQAGPSTAGSGLFVCQPTGPLARAGGQTDGGSAGQWAEKNAQKLLLHQRRSLQLGMRGSHAQMGTQAATHRIPICSHFSGLVLNYPRSIDSKIVWLMLWFVFDWILCLGSLILL